MNKFILYLLAFTTTYICVGQHSRVPSISLQKLKHLPVSLDRDTVLVQYYVGEAHLHITQDLPVTGKYIDSAYALAAENNYKPGLAWVYRLYFMHKQTSGFWEDALEYLDKAIQLNTELGNKLEVLNLKADHCNVLWDIARYDECIEKAAEVIKLSFELNSPGHTARAYHDMAYAYDGKREHLKGLESARTYVKLVHSIGTGVPRFPEKTLIYFLLKNGLEKEASLLLPDLEIHFRDYEDTFGRYFYNTQVAKGYIFLNEFEKALPYLKKGEEFARLIPSRAHDLNLAIVYFDLYYKWKKMDRAIEYLLRQHEIENEIAFEKVNAKAVELRHVQDLRAQQEQIDKLTIDKQNQSQKNLVAAFGFTILLLVYIAWNNSQLSNKNRKISEALLLGQTTERKRIASELHDNLGSSLSALKWSLLSINKDNLGHTEKSVYESVLLQVSSAYEDLRLLSHNMLPEELDKDGLENTLAKLVSKLNKSGKTNFIFQNNGLPLNLESNQSFELYNVILELCNNILKHSEASMAVIELEEDKEQLMLRVWDNGKGFNKTDKNGRGIKNIESRVLSLRGTFNFNSDKETGTRFEANVPLKI